MEMLDIILLVFLVLVVLGGVGLYIFFAYKK